MLEEWNPVRKNTKKILVSCKFWPPPPNQGVPCATGSAVSLSTPICYRFSRRQLRASVIFLSSMYERRLQQTYTAFVKLFLEPEVSESVTTCFALHCCRSSPHEYLNLCRPSLAVTWLVALLLCRPDQYLDTQHGPSLFILGHVQHSKPPIKNKRTTRQQGQGVDVRW